MKLQKLHLLHDELSSEFEGESIKTSIYYYHEDIWRDLTRDEIPLKQIEYLDASKNATEGYRATNGCIVFYYFPELQSCVSIAFQTAPRSERRNATKIRLKKVLQRATNAYKVSHNPLTQLLARDAFREKFLVSLNSMSISSVETSQVQDVDDSKVMALLALDIDYFKQVNDTHGHLYGDQVLKAFAIRLENTAERLKLENPTLEAIVGHPSGEEFLISLQANTNRETFLAWAELFKSAIEEAPLPSDEEWERLKTHEDLSVVVFPPAHDRIVTASIGVAFTGDVIKADENKTIRITAMLEAADTALYRAKAAGRNQVVTFEDILLNYGRVLEHDKTSRIVAIDIGKDIGVLVGQEFKVYSPKYTGKQKFSINDGRTKRAVGVYPKLAIATIYVFDVQREISFAHIHGKEQENIEIPIGATLEVIPSGSIGHLLSDSQNNLPISINSLKVGDSLAVQKFVKDSGSLVDKPSAIVCRFGLEKEYLKKYGNAAYNAALAKLYQKMEAALPGFRATSLLDSSSICMVAPFSSFDQKIITEAVKKISSNDFSELMLRVGVFIPSTKILISASPHAIELAQYAASDYATEDPREIVFFAPATAYKILSVLWKLKAYSQGVADFEAFHKFGVTSPLVLNIGGLFLKMVGRTREALDHSMAALALEPTQLIYRSNVISLANEAGEIEIGLTAANKWDNEELQKLLEGVPYGYFCYAHLLAQAKLSKHPSFDEEKFKLIASTAINLSQFKDRKEITRIVDAMNLAS